MLDSEGSLDENIQCFYEDTMEKSCDDMLNALVYKKVMTATHEKFSEHSIKLRRRLRSREKYYIDFI